MRVRDVMTTNLITVDTDTPLKGVVDTLLDNDVSAVPVVDASGALAGIITEADVMTREAYGPHRRRPLRLLAAYFAGRDPGDLKRAAGQTAGEIMSPRVITIGPDEDVRVAARRMLERDVKRLVVTDDRGIAGIVSRPDVLKLFFVPDGEVEKELDELLADPMRAPERHDVQFRVHDGVVTLEGTTLHPSDARVIAHMVFGLPGVVDVENRLRAREPEPTPSAPMMR